MTSSIDIRLPLRLAAVLAALLLAAGASACGSSDDDDSGDGSASTTESVASSPEQEGNRLAASVKLTGDRAQARAGAGAVDAVYDNLAGAVKSGVTRSNRPLRETLTAAEKDAAVIELCGLLSKQAKDQTIAFAKASVGLPNISWTCESAMGLLLRRARQLGGLKQSLDAEVVGVDVKGSKATATVDFGGKKGKPSEIQLVKEDGSWKLAAAPGGGG